jgi:hypothetical protein
MGLDRVVASKSSGVSVIGQRIKGSKKGVKESSKAAESRSEAAGREEKATKADKKNQKAQAVVADDEHIWRISCRELRGYFFLDVQRARAA